MIVRPANGDLWLITQPDHAGVSAVLMTAWQADGFPRSADRETVLLATREHDNGWTEPDAAPTVNPATKQPFDFLTAPVEIRQSVWPRGIRRLAGRQPFAAALVAEHALTVYGRYRQDPAWAGFLGSLRASRAEMLAGSGRSEAELSQAYRFVFLGDLISLVWCNGWTGPQRGEGYTVRSEGARVIIEPDPFGGLSVPIRVPYRSIPGRPYDSDGDLQRMLARAPVLWLEGMAAGTGA